MNIRKSPTSRVTLVAAGLVAVLAVLPVAVVVVASILRYEVEPKATVPEFPQLEAQYMECINADKTLVAAGQVMDNDMLFHCSAVSAQLQTLKFGGDFQKLHDWTNRHGR